MVSRSRGLAFLAGLLLLIMVTFTLFSYFFIPLGKFNELLNEKLSQQGVRLSAGFRKTLLPGIAFDKPVLSSEQGDLLKLDSLKVRISLLRLLTGKVAFTADASAGDGKINSLFALNGKSAFELEADGIQLADIPFFKSILGARVSGKLWSSGQLERDSKGLNGAVKLEVKQLEMSGVRLGAFSLPEATGLKTRGIVRVSGGNARLESFTLESEGVYMRLSGELPVGRNAAVTPLDMTLEIMPKADFLEKQKLIFMLLAKFMTSPGVYRLPITGTLLKPQIL